MIHHPYHIIKQTGACRWTREQCFS